MKAVSYLLVASLCIALFSSCKKDSGTDNGGGGDQVDPAIVAKSNDFKAYIVGKKFQVTDFYSDKPIDYKEDDTITTKETQLYEYTSPWIRDDLYSFDTANGKVTIDQGPEKIESDSDSLIVKDFSITAEKTGVKFNFYNHDYESLKYTLVETTDTYFLVYVDWLEGSKVFTKFSVK